MFDFGSEFLADFSGSGCLRMGFNTTIFPNVLPTRRLAVHKDNSYLYAVHCAPDYVKVGLANHLYARLSCLQTGNPLTLKVIGAWRISRRNRDQIEEDVHLLMRPFWVRGGEGRP